MAVIGGNDDVLAALIRRESELFRLCRLDSVIDSRKVGEVKGRSVELVDAIDSGNSAYEQSKDIRRSGGFRRVRTLGVRIGRRHRWVEHDNRGYRRHCRNELHIWCGDRGRRDCGHKPLERTRRSRDCLFIAVRQWIPVLVQQQQLGDWRLLPSQRLYERIRRREPLVGSDAKRNRSVFLPARYER